MNQSNDLFGEAIYVYSRAQAITDGVLVDVSNIAKQAGFKISVAVTHTVWHEYIEWTDEDSSRQTMQDANGRLWDVLWMLCVANKLADFIIYPLYVVPRHGKTKQAKNIKLKSIISGGDAGEPVITIMLPHED